MRQFAMKIVESSELNLCFHPAFPDRARHVIIHEYLSSVDLSRVDSSLNGSQRQRFQRLMRGMDWAKFIRDNANWSLSSIGWMRDRGVILPEGLDYNLEGRGFNPEWKYDGRDLCGYVLCPSFSLLEQFMVSNMPKAVYTMLDAGFPREIEQPLFYRPGSPKNRIPLLLWACRHCYLDIIKFLVIERNASIDVFESVDVFGNSYCLLEVCEKNSSTENLIDDSKRVEILRFLIDKAGADITIRVVGGRSLLDLASERGQIGVVKYILEEKKDILKPEESQNVARIAVRKFDHDLLVYLIEKQGIKTHTIMDTFYEAVKLSKMFERMYGLSLARMKEEVSRRDHVKSYLKGLIGEAYNSDEEESDGWSD